MSVSDPLIKEVKAHTLKFLEQNASKPNAITDVNPTLLPFCITIEKIFNNGLGIYPNTLYLNKPVTKFSWMLSLINDKNNSIINFAYTDALEKVQNYKNVLTDNGKFRLLIRMCLVRKCLHVPLEYLSKTQRNVLFYNKVCVIGDEILLEILLSYLMQYKNFNFQLDIENSAFLDMCWQLPKTVKFEFVPTDTLGIAIRYTGEKAIIVKVESNSVASENEAMKPGDVLDQLNGKHINTASKGHLNNILQSKKGQPVTCTIVKLVDDNDVLFPPIKSLLKEINIDANDFVETKQIETPKPLPGSNKLKFGPAFKVKYVGNAIVGPLGDTKQISKAMRMLFPLNSFQADKDKDLRKIVNQEVYFELQDLYVKVFDAEAKKMILEHSFMKISACGSGELTPNYFAYVVGNDICNIATSFTCYVFHSKDMEYAMFLLKSLGQGFHRTHYAV